MTAVRSVSRRTFLWSLGAAPFVPSFLSSYKLLAEPLEKRVKITDIQTMVMQGPRTYTLVKVSTDAGLYGIAEAYGSPGIGVKEQIQTIKASFIGQDPLGVDTLYTNLGNRVDGSAHQMMRAISGIEMAIWDLNGKILDVPTWKLLGGKFRDRVRVYDHSGPSNHTDKTVVAEWAARTREHPSGFTAHKFGPQFDPPAPGAARGRGAAAGGRATGAGAAGGRAGAAGAEGGDGEGGGGRGGGRGSMRTVMPSQIHNVQLGADMIREALGWNQDFMIHGGWNWNVRTAIDIASALGASKPLWFEDPLPVVYSDSWKRLTEMSPVAILMGENLARREDFAPFIVNQGCDMLHPDLRNTGGFLETKRIADFGAVFSMPMGTHNTGSQVNTWAAAQFASTIRDYVGLETITGEGGWMDQVLLLDGPYIKDGFITMTEKPGLGYELNPDVVRAHLAPGETWWK